MLTVIGKTFVAIVRNWTMVIALVISNAFAMHHAAEREWLHFAGLAAVVIGIGANLSVMVINGGRMPVLSPDTSWLETSTGHQRTHGKTRLAFLGDWISVHDWLISPGDICLYAGLAIFFVSHVFD